MHLLKFRLLDWKTLLRDTRITDDDKIDEYSSVLLDKGVDITDFEWLKEDHLMKLGITNIIHAGRIIQHGKKVYFDVSKFAFCRIDHDFLFLSFFL